MKREVKAVIIDMEWTCWGADDKKPKNSLREILSIGAIKVDKNFNTIGTFSRTVKPTENPQLSSYCKELTKLKQKDIDKSQGFCEVFSSLERWINKNPEFEHIYFWGSSDELVLKKQAESLGYDGEIIKWMNEGKIIDIQPILLEDIHKKLNLNMSISLRGAKKFYGIKTPVTHNPLKDSEDVRHLWRVKNYHKGNLNEDLIGCARHMNTINQLLRRVIFVEKETAWLSKTNTNKPLNKIKLGILYRFLSRISSKGIYVYEGDNSIDEELLLDFNCESNSIVTNLDRDYDDFSDWKYSMKLINKEDSIPMGFIAKKGFKRYKVNANILDNGLSNECIDITDKNINITLGKVVYKDIENNKKQYRMILIINGIIFWIEESLENKKAYNNFMKDIKVFSLAPYPLQG